MVLAATMASGLACRKAHRALAPAAPSTTPGPLAPGLLPPKLWLVPPFAFRGTDGQTISEQNLAGHTWIADFIFTRCVTMCPIITAEMNVLRKAMPSADLRFVSFSVDPEYDTPAVLKAYATTWNGDPRWLLLSPPPTQVLEFAKAMKVPFKRTPMVDEPILHTTLFFLVDRAGWVRGIYGALDDADLRRLMADTSMLDASDGTTPATSRSPPPSDRLLAETPASRGRTLFRALGCGACHDTPKLGPPLGGIAGRTVMLEGGATALADDAYLRQSILNPEEKVVRGYNILMPAYRDHLAPADVDALVAHLHSLGAPGGASGASSTASAPEMVESEVEDPVCGMRMKAAGAAARVDDHGKSFYFCSERCRTRFMQEPGRYVRP